MLAQAQPKQVVSKQVVSKKQTVVVHAEDFNLAEDSFFTEIKTGKFRTVKLQVSKDNKAKVHIQFSRGPGQIPNKFGVDTNQYGKTYLTFSVPDEEEFESMTRIKSAACKIAATHKDSWWPKGITADQISDNFNTFIGEKNPKKDGAGFWPAQMKVAIPLDADSGEAIECEVLDDDCSAISIHDLPGRQWDDIIIELTGIYFQGKYSWGFGPKKLVKIKLAEDVYGNSKEAVSFLGKKEPRAAKVAMPKVAVPKVEVPTIEAKAPVTKKRKTNLN